MGMVDTVLLWMYKQCAMQKFLISGGDSYDSSFLGKEGASFGTILYPALVAYFLILQLGTLAIILGSGNYHPKVSFS
jgi:hypothetical protein